MEIEISEELKRQYEKQADEAAAKAAVEAEEKARAKKYEYANNRKIADAKRKKKRKV